MRTAPTRVEWQQLAECRIEDARAHLDPAVGRWAAAYYLIGYAVECGLKACVMARVMDGAPSGETEPGAR